MQLARNIKLLSWFNFSYSFNLYYGIAIIYFAQVTHSFIGSICFAIFGLFADRVGPAISLRAAQFFLLPIIVLYWLVFHTDKQGLS